jgi:hypothetical protein
MPDGLTVTGATGVEEDVGVDGVAIRAPVIVRVTRQ